ncbi:MAG: hypothetical protein RLZZ403_1671 [Pseudomonadota bacterium]|jgi:hypothetical protein
MNTELKNRAARTWLAAARRTVLFGLSVAALSAWAGQAPPAPPPQGKAGAPFDVTGYWVSVVTEDWMDRMVTSRKGEFPSMPLNPAGRQLANAWDPAEDGSCKAYGAAGLMRMPTRVRFSWESDNVLKLETDAGQQTRRFVFSQPRPANTAKSLQGYSAALWQFPLRSPLRGDPPPTGGASLQVVTTDLEGAWLRRNGVPYSADARVTEYFDQFKAQDGTEWLTVTTLVDDPTYLAQQYVTSSHFRREKDGSNWAPAPCKPVR